LIFLPFAGLGVLALVVIRRENRARREREEMLAAVRRCGQTEVRS
jgi:preprotein translocase subunit YajC